jgi:hypothetical protein
MYKLFLCAAYLLLVFFDSIKMPKKKLRQSSSLKKKSLRNREQKKWGTFWYFVMHLNRMDQVFSANSLLLEPHNDREKSSILKKESQN